MMWYAKEYNPIQVGSIDGTDIDPHDAAITRATLSHYRPPKHAKTDPQHTLFVGRLNFETTESTLKPFFEKYGPVSNVELIRNDVTGLSQGYAFITFTDSTSTKEAYKYAHESTLDNHIILVDYERSRVMKNWIPRRFGGGFGGKKESGQLRFGARDRPFRDNNGKMNIHYDEKKSDVWRSTSHSHHRNRSPSRERSHRGKSSSRERSHRGRSSSRDRRHKSNHRNRSSSRDRNHRSKERSHRYRPSSRDRRHGYASSSSSHHHRSVRNDESDRHYSNHKRKRLDDTKDYSRSSRQKFISKQK